MTSLIASKELNSLLADSGLIIFGRMRGWHSNTGSYDGMDGVYIALRQRNRYIRILIADSDLFGWKPYRRELP